MPRQASNTIPTATEWPRAIVAEPAGRYIAARVRVIDTTVLVMNREHQPVWTYTLDGPPIVDPDSNLFRLIGTVDGEPLTIEADGGCMCESFQWIGVPE